MTNEKKFLKHWRERRKDELSDKNTKAENIFWLAMFSLPVPGEVSFPRLEPLTYLGIARQLLYRRAGSRRAENFELVLSQNNLNLKEGGTFFLTST